MRKLPIMNKACLAKLCWKFFTEDKALWCSVIRVKYKRKYVGDGMGEAKFYDLNLWKSLVNC